jgi:hypothetical protein
MLSPPKRNSSVLQTVLAKWLCWGDSQPEKIPYGCFTQGSGPRKTGKNSGSCVFLCQPRGYTVLSTITGVLILNNEVKPLYLLSPHNCRTEVWRDENKPGFEPRKCRIWRQAAYNQLSLHCLNLWALLSSRS